MRKKRSGLRKRDRLVRNRPRKRPFCHHRAENTTFVPKNTTEIDRSQQRAENTTSVPKNTTLGSIFSADFSRATKNTTSVPPKRRAILFLCVRRLEVGNFKVLIIIPENGTMTTVFEKPKKSATQPQVGRSLTLAPHTSHLSFTSINRPTQPQQLLLLAIQLNHHAGGGNDDGSSYDGRGRAMQR